MTTALSPLPETVATAEQQRTDRPDVIVWLAGLVALIPTIVSGWGMFGVFRAMGMPFVVSAGTSFFLEGLLVNLALLARRAIQRERSARIELMWTWLVSLTSGCLSAAHDFVGPGGHMIEPTLMTYISATVRVVAPLAAALMWHRVLVGDKLDSSPLPPLAERRARTAVFDAACAAQDVSSARTDAARDAAMEDFRKAWRHAISRSMMYWTPEQLTQAGRTWAHVLVVGDDIAGAARRDALEAADPSRLAESRRIPDPEEWMGVGEDNPAGTDGARANAAGREAEGARPAAAAGPAPVMTLEQDDVDLDAPFAPRADAEEDDTIVIMVPRLAARTPEPAPAAAPAPATAEDEAPEAADQRTPLRDPEPEAAPEPGEGMVQETAEHEATDEDAHGIGDDAGLEDHAADGADTHEHLSAAEVRMQLATSVVSAGGNATDLAVALRNAGQSVPSHRTCRRLLAQARVALDDAERAGATRVPEPV